MLGFVILVGIVVNNAILLVHQTLFYTLERSMEPMDAITMATHDGAAGSATGSTAGPGRASITVIPLKVPRK